MTRPVPSADDRSPPSPGAGARRRRGHRGRARRPARPAADRHARPRPRQLLRARGRARRRHRRPRPARAGARSSSSSSAWPAPASRCARVHTVVVTHSHPDHFGGAGWVRDETGAEIVTHQRFRMIWDRTEPPDLDVEDVAADAPASRTAAVGPAAVGRRGPPLPVQAADADARREPGARAVHDAGADRPPRRHRGHPPRRARVGRRCTRPGHTEDHLCLFDPTEGVMLSGDHVLPTITPHIGGLSPQRRPAARVLRVARQGRRLRARTCTSCCPPTATRSTTSPGGPRRSRSTTSSASTCSAGPPRSSAARPACRSCRRTCSRPGRRARWPTARRSPTSSTCAGPASSSAATHAARLPVRQAGLTRERPSAISCLRSRLGDS